MHTAKGANHQTFSLQSTAALQCLRAVLRRLADGIAGLSEARHLFLFATLATQLSGIEAIALLSEAPEATRANFMSFSVQRTT